MTLLAFDVTVTESGAASQDSPAAALFDLSHRALVAAELNGAILRSQSQTQGREHVTASRIMFIFLGRHRSQIAELVEALDMVARQAVREDLLSDDQGF